MIASRTPEPRRHIYRCYFLDEQGRFLDFELIDCTSDKEAIDRARRLFADRHYCSRFEVWDGARRLPLDRADETKTPHPSKPDPTE